MELNHQIISKFIFGRQRGNFGLMLLSFDLNHRVLNFPNVIRHRTMGIMSVSCGASGNSDSPSVPLAEWSMFSFPHAEQQNPPLQSEI